MGIDWEELFMSLGRAAGAGLTTYGSLLHEKAVDEREEQQLRERAEYAAQLDKERETSRQDFQRTLAKDMAEMNSSLRMKEKETSFVFDTLGLELGRQYTEVWNLPQGDPRRQEVLDKIDYSSMLLAQAKAGETEFATEQLENLSSDFRIKFTSIINDNKRFEQDRALNELNIKSQMQLRLTQAETSKATMEYYKFLKENGQPVDQLKALKERQRQLGLIDGIKSSDAHMFVQRALASGENPEDIARGNPVFWNAFLRGEMLIREANSIAVQQGLIGGMSPEDLGLTKPERKEERKEGKKEKLPGILQISGVGKAVGQAVAGQPIAEAAAKIISPTTARNVQLDRALGIGLKKARKKYGASVMSYEQAIDLKDSRPGAANKQRFVGLRPATEKEKAKVALFEFYTEKGTLKARFLRYL